MRNLVLAAVLAATTTVAPAMAQNVPPPGGPGGPGGAPAGMRAFHQQFRDQLLSALTPAHKQLLASIAGKLATEDRPDFAAAAKQLDDALSPQEKSTILADAKAAHEKMLALAAQRGMQPPQFHHAPVDAGRILLMMAAPPPMMR